jgi:Protein of unknown function (DUF5818)
MMRLFPIVFVLLFVGLTFPVQSKGRAISSLQTQAPPAAETFAGTIQKRGENFVLSDLATKTSYALDNQKLASTFEGKRVRVTGTLEKASNLIHVQTIQEIV